MTDAILPKEAVVVLGSSASLCPANLFEDTFVTAKMTDAMSPKSSSRVGDDGGQEEMRAGKSVVPVKSEKQRRKVGFAIGEDMGACLSHKGREENGSEGSVRKDWQRFSLRETQELTFAYTSVCADDGETECFQSMEELWEWSDDDEGGVACMDGSD